MTKTLIVGTTYCNAPEKAELLRMWAALNEKLSPECDVIVIDSCSPMDVLKVLPAFAAGYAHRGYYKIEKDVGSLQKGGQDGPGQAFCKGVEFAISGGYEYFAHIETDCLFAKPVGPIISSMEKAGVKCAAPMDFTHSFLETQVLFMSVPWLRDKNYIEAYDWTNPSKRANPYHEVWLEKFAGDDLFCLPLRGCRNDLDKITVNNCHLAFGRGWDYISHARDFGLYRRFMEYNNISI